LFETKIKIKITGNAITRLDKSGTFLHLQPSSALIIRLPPRAEMNTNTQFFKDLRDWEEAVVGIMVDKKAWCAAFHESRRKMVS